MTMPTSRRQVSLGVLLSLSSVLVGASLMAQDAEEHSEKERLSRKQIYQESQEISQEIIKLVENYHDTRIPEKHQVEMQSEFYEEVVAELSKYYHITD